jgi:SagB-type dehydrogenase family enzyme
MSVNAWFTGAAGDRPTIAARDDMTEDLLDATCLRHSDRGTCGRTGAGCGGEGEAEGGFMLTTAGSEIQGAALPAPEQHGTVPLERTLAHRRSIRDFTDAPIGVDTIGQLLGAAQGDTDAEGHRTAPSAGALYPLEAYVATREGLFHYDPDSHRLVRRAADPRTAIARAAHGQDAVRSAPVVIVFTAVYGRTATKYGGRAERYVHMEAGHAAQNVLLQATALRLGAVPVGAFDDDALALALSLPRAERPVYLIPVGHPRP